MAYKALRDLTWLDTPNVTISKINKQKPDKQKAINAS